MGDSFPDLIPLPRFKNDISERPKLPRLKINKFYNVNNIVNKIKYIVGATVYQRLEKSFLGPVLKAVDRELELSAKLLHCIMTRSLITKKENELWFCFGWQPMRFSIREFHIVTGLKCSGDEKVEEAKVKWYDLETNKHTLQQLENKLKRLNSEDEEYSLSMLLIIESLFLSKGSARYFDVENIKIAKDTTVLENYPWGKKAYNILLESVSFHIDNYMGKDTLNINGFPLALHIWILQSIPVLMSSFSRVDNNCNGFLCERFLKFDTPSLDAILDCETDDVEVVMILPPVENDSEDSISLEDKEDNILQGMIDLVSQRYRFKFEEWGRGYVEYVEAIDAIATQKCKNMSDKDVKAEEVEEEEEEKQEEKQEEEPVEVSNNLNIATMFNFINHQFESLAERMTKIEEQMKILNENVVKKKLINMALLLFILLFLKIELIL